MFLPDMYRPKEFGKALTKGLLIGSAVLLFVVIRDISVLGQMAELESFPTFTAIRQINVGDILTRMDIIYVATLLSLMFYKVAALFYTSVTGVQRLMRFGSYQILVYIFGALLLLYSLTVFRSTSEHVDWLINVAAEIFQTFFLVFLPFLTLIVAACRGFFGNNPPVPENET
jgi:spore germination protein KB